MNSTPINLAIKSLLAQKTRSILTILGISIGIAVVITIMSAGRGLDKFILGQLESYDPNTIVIEIKIPSTKKNSNENAMGQAQGIQITTLKERDLEAVQKNKNIVAAYGFITGQEVISYQGVNKTVLVFGEGYQMPEVEKFELSEGRMFTKDEEDSISQVLILGAKTKTDLFGEDSATGKTVYVRGKPFKVLGVSKERGSAFFMDMDSLAIIPTKTIQKRLLGIDYYNNSITGKVKDASLMQETITELESTIRENHDITDPAKDDFAIRTMEEAITMLKSVVQGITILLVALVCISLLVGGVGIMNIMYVSVTERIFEIGLRKSLGAKRSDILKQFLYEAIILTLCGGILGIIIGAILSLIIYLVAIYYNFQWVYVIPIESIILAIGFSALIGIIFGLYPARRASKLEPIDALRQE